MEIKGYTAVPNHVIKDPELPAVSKALYMYLLSFNPSFPSYTKIESEMGMSRPTISKHLRLLRDMGYLKIIKKL